MITIGISESSTITAERDGYCIGVTLIDPEIECKIYLSVKQLKAIENILNLMYDIRAEKIMPEGVELEEALKYAIQEQEAVDFLRAMDEREEQEERERNGG